VRIRTIKPEFWTNEELAALPPLARLVFIGLWNLADRRGRLEDRPRRIQVSILPYEDDVNINALLKALEDAGFIDRYIGEGAIAVIQVINFEKHQRITGKEAEVESKLPGKQLGSIGETPGKHPGIKQAENDRGNNGETTGKHPGAQEGRKEGKGSMEGEGGDLAPRVIPEPKAKVAPASPTRPLPAALEKEEPVRPAVAPIRPAPAPEFIEERNGDTNHPPLEAVLAHWQKHRERTGEHFEPNEVRECFRQFEAAQDGHGAWTWGRRQVGDWRAAMQQRMMDNRERRGGKKPAMTAGDVMAKECAAALRRAGIE
jgi:hypothetical protein